MGLIKKDLLIKRRHAKCHCYLLADFENGDKNVNTFLKGEQILLLLRNCYRKIGTKLIISYSLFLTLLFLNKILPVLNASKA